MNEIATPFLIGYDLYFISLFRFELHSRHLIGPMVSNLEAALIVQFRDDLWEG